MLDHPSVREYAKAYQRRHSDGPAFKEACRVYAEHMASVTPDGAIRIQMMRSLVVVGAVPPAIVYEAFGADEVRKATVRELVAEDLAARRQRANPGLIYAEMTYAEYLRTDWWQQLRRRAIDEANGECALCGTTARIQVHHRRYPGRGAEQLKDLIVLCAGCHERHHGELLEARRGR